MFKVFKSKEVIGSNINNGNNNQNNKDILDDFNNYQNNNINNNLSAVNGANNPVFNNGVYNNNFQNNNGINSNVNVVGNTMFNNNMPNNGMVNNGFQNNMFNNNSSSNSNDVKTIDLNQNIIDAQKLREEHSKSYQQRLDNVGSLNEFGQSDDINKVNNTKDNLDYKYNEQLKKHNALDNIKNIINSGTDDASLDDNVDSIDNNIPVQNNMINNQNIDGNMFNQQAVNQATVNPYNNFVQQPIYNNMQNMQQMGMYQGNMPYNNAFPQQNVYPNQMYQQPMMNGMQQVPQFKPSDIMVYSVPVQNYQQPFAYQTPHPSQFQQSQAQNANLLQPNVFGDTEPGFKRCPKCGQKLRDDYKQCFVCGTWLN